MNPQQTYKRKEEHKSLKHFPGANHYSKSNQFCSTNRILGENSSSNRIKTAVKPLKNSHLMRIWGESMKVLRIWGESMKVLRLWGESMKVLHLNNHFVPVWYQEWMQEKEKAYWSLICNESSKPSIWKASFWWMCSKVIQVLIQPRDWVLERLV